MDRGYGTPEEIASARERIPSLFVTDRRLGNGRWLRSRNVSLFSPRHPLFVEIEDELLRDPSLAMGGFRCSSATANVPPGTYLLVQSQTHPALGGEAMSWRCELPPDALVDEELSRLWTSAREALRRMMRVRFRSEVSRSAWRIDACGEPRAEPHHRVDALLAALPSAKSERVEGIHRGVDGILAAMERPPSALPMAALTIAELVAESVTRDAGLSLDRIIARRRSAIDDVGDGDSWRGLRDRRARDVAAAQAMRDALEDLPRHARVGATEALTPRALVAAVFEVGP